MTAPPSPAVHDADEDLPRLISTPLPGPKTKAMVERDQRVMSPSYTRDYPFVMERGKGSIVWDPDGNRFLDMAAGIAVCSTGHCHPHVVKAVTDQAGRYFHMSGTDFYYEPQIRLAERLGEYAPLRNKKQPLFFFTNSGTEAVEGAMKLARYYTRRQNVISFFGAFHGRTYGAMSLTASKAVQRQHFGPWVPNTYHVPYCYPARCRSAECAKAGECALGCLKELTDVLAAKVLAPDTIAAVIVEPIQGEGGYIVPTDTWLKGLRAWCTEHGILMICDEVQSGMGRTGKMFAISHTSVEPDIIVTAKGIASGLPLGAIIADKALMTWPPGSHGTTFGGNPVACAAANATVDLLESEMMENARVVGDHLKARLVEITKGNKRVTEVRGKGLMIGVEIQHPDGTPDKKTRDMIVNQAYYEGMLILGCGPNTVRFSPPLCLTKSQADWAASCFGRLLKRADG